MLFCFVARRSKLKCTARLGYCFLLVYTLFGRRRVCDRELSCSSCAHLTSVSSLFLLAVSNPALRFCLIGVERASSNLYTLHTAQQVLLVFTPSSSSSSSPYLTLSHYFQDLPNQGLSSSFTTLTQCTLCSIPSDLLLSLSFMYSFFKQPTGSGFALKKKYKPSTWTRQPRVLQKSTSRYGISLPMRCCSCCRRTVLVFFAITCYIKAAKSLLRLCVAYFSFLSLLAVTALETTTTTVLEVFVTTPSTSDDDDNGDTFLRLLLPSSFKSNNTPHTRCLPRPLPS